METIHNIAEVHEFERRRCIVLGGVTPVTELSFSCHLQLFTFQPVNQTEENWEYVESLLRF